LPVSRAAPAARGTSPTFGGDDLGEATDIVERYQDQDIGIADASLVVLAARYRTDRVLTLDHRHLTVLRTSQESRSACCPDRAVVACDLLAHLDVRVAGGHRVEAGA